MGSSRSSILFLLLLLLSITHLPLSYAQRSVVNPPAAAPAPPPLSPADACVGAYLKYTLNYRTKIHPYLPHDPTLQPFAFRSTAIVVNTDAFPVEMWSLHIGFPNETILVSATSSVLSDGSSFPYEVGSNDTSGASFTGFPSTNLKTAIETAGDMTDVQAIINIAGTDYGVVPPTAPPRLPASLTLDNPDFICKPLKVPYINPNFMHTCCERDPKFKPNSSISDPFLSRRSGDLLIDYDVLAAYDSSYLARVTIKNNNSLGRLDNWELNWEWMQGEFILKMQGAVTTTSDPSKCIFGAPGQFYGNLDFSTVLNCDRRPTIVDLPVTMANDDNLGRIPFCCRNGTILPETIDPERSASAFQLQVFKMPPFINRTKLAPPQNWAIAGSNGALNPLYNCSAPIRVSPSVFPNAGGLPTSSLAMATWQVVCNITRKKAPPRCCVSFSAFYNDSAIPCKTCACGFPAGAEKKCNVKAPAMLIPPDGLLKAYANRTIEALEWAQIKSLPVPRPLPCGDNCGVSVNWHVYTDYSNGWSARITLFNWGEADIPDWFAAFVMPRAYDGFEATYSFNGTAVGNDTIFVAGLPGLNYLIKVSEGAQGKNPGKLQSVISFSKKTTPGINVVAGDGYPKKLYFNGEECSIPDRIPMSSGSKMMESLWRLGVAMVLTGMVFMGI